MAFSEDLKALYAVGAVSAGDIFLGTRAKIPSDAGPYTSIVETPGFPPEYIHNQDRVAYNYLTAQILVRAAERVDASARARLHFAATTVWNRVINGTFYKSIRPSQEPWDFGLDDTGRIVYFFNVRGEKSPA